MNSIYLGSDPEHKVKGKQVLCVAAEYRIKMTTFVTS